MTPVTPLGKISGLMWIQTMVQDLLCTTDIYAFKYFHCFVLIFKWTKRPEFSASGNVSCSCFYQTTFHQKKYSSTKYSLLWPRWLTLEAKSKCSISTNSNYAAHLTKQKYGVGIRENPLIKKHPPPKKATTTNFHRKFFTQGVTTKTVFFDNGGMCKGQRPTWQIIPACPDLCYHTDKTQSSLITQHQKHKSSKTVKYLRKISVNVGYPDIWSHEKNIQNKIQTHKQFKIMLFIRTKHNMLLKQDPYTH